MLSPIHLQLALWVKIYRTRNTIFLHKKKMSKTVTPYGTWKSPITSEHLIVDKVTLKELKTSNSSIYFVENRPQEKGRAVIVDALTGKDVIPQDFSARSLGT